MPGILSPRVIVIWVVAVIALFGVTIYVSLFWSGPEPAGPSAFSRSALGHAGLADALRRLGVRVVRSRGDSAGKVDPSGILVLAEPSLGIDRQKLNVLLNANKVLLVLPKRVGRESGRHPGWVDAVIDLPLTEAKNVLQTAVPDAELVRITPPVTWRQNELKQAPTVDESIQLIKSSRLRPVVAAEEGILVGELRSDRRVVWVLSDPDIIENHGVGRPGNAPFVIALLNALSEGGGNVVFDETIHGLTDRSGSPWLLLFEFPFVLATIQGLIAVALLLWATMGRFGAPLTPPRALQAGKHSLIQNSARLLELAGYQPVVTARYIQTVIRDVGRQLHAPAGMTDSDLVDWLSRTARARDVSIDCSEVLTAADQLPKQGRAGYAALVVLARDIFRWKGEIVDGVSRNRRADRGDSRRGPQSGGRPG